MGMLNEITLAAQARQAATILAAILNSDEIEIIVVESEGCAEADGQRFTYVDGGLALLGICPMCTQEVPSRKIRRAADIASQISRFRPASHECMDIDA